MFYMGSDRIGNFPLSRRHGGGGRSKATHTTRRFFLVEIIQIKELKKRVKPLI